MRKLIVFIIICFVIIVSIIVSKNNKNKTGKIILAIAAPLSNEKSKGITMLNSIQMMVDEVNESGGIHGIPLELVRFNDKNNNKTAIAVAKQIAIESKALAVIGHRSSGTSVAASPIYNRYHVPSITGTATADDITLNNPWAFRVIFNSAQQGKLIAHYITEILEQKEVSIIYDEDAYGQSLYQSFQQTAQQVGLKIRFTQHFANKHPDAKAQIQQIIQNFSQQPHKRVLFLAVHDIEAVTIIKQLRDENLDTLFIGGVSIGKQSFSKRFKKFPLEQISPGYYTDGIITATYFLYDVAGNKAQAFRQSYRHHLNKDPGAQAASSYDAAGIVISAMKHTHVKGKDIKGDRQKIRDYLASINVLEKAYQGVSGLIYFDHNGDAVRNVPMASFVKQKLISAPFQITRITDPKRIIKLKRKQQQKGANEKDILVINHQFMQQTNVIYAGGKIIHIGNIDLKNLSATVELFIWFRYKGKFDHTQIKFSNSVGDIILEAPIKKNASDNFNYQLHKVKGTFQLNYSSEQNELGQYSLGFGFHHELLQKDKLIFVVDLVGMTFSLAKEFVDVIVEPGALASNAKWSLSNANLFQNNLNKETYGHFELLGSDDKTEFSQINFNITLESENISLYKFISKKMAMIILIGATIIYFIIIILKIRNKKNNKLLFLIFILVSLFSSQILIINWAKSHLSFHQLNHLVNLYEVIWYLIPIYILNIIIRKFIWDKLETQSNREVSTFLKLFISFILYLLAIFAIIAFVYDQKLTSLLATSGLFVMIIGLAIQLNISNIFSGIALSLDQPFKIGHWISITDCEPGKVIDMNWRAIRLLTSTDYVYSIPNNIIAESAILNYHSPDDYYTLYFPIHINSIHPPDTVMQCIMNALIESKPVSFRNGPFVRMTYEPNAIAYYPVFELKDYANRNGDKNLISKNIWRHLQHAGIYPSVARQQLTHKNDDDKPLESQPQFDINDIHIFKNLPEMIKNNITEHMLCRFVQQGTVIFCQGDEGTSMFVIGAGVISIRAIDERGEINYKIPHIIDNGGLKWKDNSDNDLKTKEIARLGAGQFMGEMSLFTGSKRTATAIALTDCWLFEIAKETLKPIIQEYPQTMETLANYILEREENLRQQLEKNKDSIETKKQIKLLTLKNIRKFFDI